MTIHYQFPDNITLDEVRDILKDNENFIIVENPGYTVVNYVRSGNDTFPPVYDRRMAILRELRGMIFGSDGRVISRRFHKFFNLGEREDLLDVDMSRPHQVLLKLDGSMITPIVLGCSVYWGTKMGITDVSGQASEYVHKTHHILYRELVEDCFSMNCTPIFEWCSRKNRIVIDYPEDRLVLLAVRNNISGKYWPRDSLKTLTEIYSVPLVGLETLEGIRSRQDIEGVVVQFDDGHMVKIKADTYVSLHRAKSLLDNERDVVGLVLESKTDDLLPLLPPADRDRLSQFDKVVHADVRDFVYSVNSMLDTIRDNTISRKEFAQMDGIDPTVRTFVFNCWTGDCTFEIVSSFILKHLGSARSFERVKKILITADWTRTDNEE